MELLVDGNDGNGIVVTTWSVVVRLDGTVVYLRMTFDERFIFEHGVKLVGARAPLLSIPGAVAVDDIVDDFAGDFDDDLADDSDDW